MKLKLNALNEGIITVLYRADSYLVIIHQFTSINWMELNVMILDWLERYKDEGNCDMKVYWMKWSMNVMKLTEWKQSDWTQLKLWKECWNDGGMKDTKWTVKGGRDRVDVMKLMNVFNELTEMNQWGRQRSMNQQVKRVEKARRSEWSHRNQSISHSHWVKLDD